MARMTLKAVHTDDERRRWTLSERIIDENLGNYHYVTHPLTSARDVVGVESVAHWLRGQNARRKTQDARRKPARHPGYRVPI